MFNVRSVLILGAGPVGLALGAAAWLLLDADVSSTKDVAALEARLASVRAAARTHANASAAAAQAAMLPLFPLDAASTKQAAVALQGVARSPRRQAALLSIDGQPAQWFERGQTLEGVTLVAVDAAKVVIETADGRREVGFWEAPGGPSASPPGMPQGEPAVGARMPLPPASAPGV